MDSSLSDQDYQNRILPHVSRTFALTIPQLPLALRQPVTTAYLLCRIADTIEDETTPSAAATLVLLRRFVAVLYGREDATTLTRDLLPQLSQRTLPAERDLVVNMERVVRVTAGLDERQRLALQRCVEVMCDGMHQFQQTASLRGLPLLTDLNDYCYYVAGVVGEMLTELFCAYSDEIERQRGALNEFAVSFAQGLQMTNILKDVWDDRARGACWLPQEVFTRHGVLLTQISPDVPDPRFDAGMRELVGVAHAHLRNALSYTLLIPAREAGIRRFCLWAVGLAVLTLRKIVATPGFTSGSQVKVSHLAVGMTQLLTNTFVGGDRTLRFLFERTAKGLPLTSLSTLHRLPLQMSTPPASTPSVEVSHGARRVEQLASRVSDGRSGH